MFLLYITSLITLHYTSAHSPLGPAAVAVSSSQTLRVSLRLPSASAEADESGSRGRLRADSNASSVVVELREQRGGDESREEPLQTQKQPARASCAQLPAISIEEPVDHKAVALPFAEPSQHKRAMSLKAATSGSMESVSSEEESWQVFGNFINVVAGALYVLANVIVFCVFLLPLFEQYSQNSQLISYY